jgi:SNF2 family DNA or RNA helicase
MKILNEAIFCNIIIALRKVCYHRYLIELDQLRIDQSKTQDGQSSSGLKEFGKRSGKMILLGKLLPMLGGGGWKVQITSQILKILGWGQRS